MLRSFKEYCKYGIRLDYIWRPGEMAVLEHRFVIDVSELCIDED